MKKYLGIFFIINLYVMIILTGCLESDNNKGNTDNLLEEIYQEKIIGNWYNNGKIDNVTAIIIFNFYSNSSYFTGTIIENTSYFSKILWGIYEINNDTIFLNSTDVNVVNSALKYGFSEDYNNLIINYGYEKYIIFTRL